jgi:hypothetical protein
MGYAPRGWFQQRMTDETISFCNFCFAYSAIDGGFYSVGSQGCAIPFCWNCATGSRTPSTVNHATRQTLSYKQSAFFVVPARLPTSEPARAATSRRAQRTVGRRQVVAIAAHRNVARLYWPCALSLGKAAQSPPEPSATPYGALYGREAVATDSFCLHQAAHSRVVPCRILPAPLSADCRTDANSRHHLQRSDDRRRSSLTS